MEENKYADLVQQLEETEKQLCENISNKCADKFEEAIENSIEEIKKSASNMNDVVSKVQSCKDSCDKAAQAVDKLSNTLLEADNKASGISKELDILCEKTRNATNDISEKTFEKMNLFTTTLEPVIEQVGNLSNSLSKNCNEICNLISEQQTCKKSYEEAFSEVNSLIEKLNKTKETIQAEIATMKAYQEVTQSCVDDVKKSTEEYVKLLQEAEESLAKSIDTYKPDLLRTSDEQNRLISSIKEEQLKQKKKYLFGIIAAVIIIALQIISILC